MLLILDAPSVYFRAFFGVPPRHGPDGTPTNAAAGFIDWLARLVVDRSPDRIACVLDADWRPAWRVRLIPTYKTHRLEGPDAKQAVTGGAPPGMAEPPGLAEQVPIIVTTMKAAGVAVAEHPGCEADDVIATLAHRATPPVEIVTGDRDLFQLVRDPDVRVLYPRKGVSVMDTVDEAFIAAKYSIPGRAYADLAILRGDSSDGLPGVRGIGEKTASTLLQRHGSLAAIRAAAEEQALGSLAKVKAHRDYLDAAEQVVKLPDDLDLAPMDLSRPKAPFDEATLDELGRRFNLTGPIGRLRDALY